MFQAVFLPIIRSSKTAHRVSGICQACLLLRLAVAASKLDIYPMLYVEFLSSWWWAEKPPETCRAGVGNLLLVLCRSNVTKSLSVPTHASPPYFYTGCPRRNGQNFGRVFFMLNYTDITQNTYIQSWTVTEIMAIKKCGLLGCTCTVRHPWRHTCPVRMPGLRDTAS